jgi:flavin-binding protein dodecin
MSVAKITEISAASSVSFEDAIKTGVDRASKTLKNVTSAWVQDQKVDIEDGKIVRYRVIMKISFVLE